MKNIHNILGSILILIAFFSSHSMMAQVDVSAFIYHRFGESRYAATNIDTDVFEKQLIWLKEQRLSTISVSELEKALATGNKLEGVMITIDDAYSSFYQNAFPLIKKYQIKASLFVNTEQVGQKGYMSWSQIKEVMEAGIEIGNHTHTHLQLLSLPKSERQKKWKEELQTSQTAFQQHVGFVPKYFAYPYGEYDDQYITYLKEAGFSLAFAQHSGGISLATNIFALPRFPMGAGFATLQGFQGKARMKGFDLHEVSQVVYSYDHGAKPVLQWIIREKGIRTNELQVFVDGQKVEYSLEHDKITVNLKNRPLSKRRTILTITAPNKNGKWHWYSKLLLVPEIPES